MSPAQLSAALRQLAESFEALAADSPDLNLWASFEVQPRGAEDTEVVAAVDAVGLAAINAPGRRYTVAGGQAYHHGVHGSVDGLNVSIYQRLDEKPEPAEVAS